MYGADICLAAAQRGMKSYAISAFCIHNSEQKYILPKEFYQCCRHVKRIWKEYLPIQTTCIRITKYNLPLYRRKLQEAYLRYIARKAIGPKRLKNVQGLLERFKDTGRGLMDCPSTNEPEATRQSP
jgi:hypothetical protein